MCIAVLAQVRSVSVGRPRLRQLAGILVLPDQLGCLVESGFIKALILARLLVATSSLAYMLLEIHILHRLS
jgi:hypothetical protein